MIKRFLFGREVIISDAKEITRDNLIYELTQALNVHSGNADDIDYLYQYYKGNQPILYREKIVRPEIINNIVENRANEIVSFKTGYLMGEPVQYVGRAEGIADKISKLNGYVFAEDMPSKNKELADWMHICGLGYKIILPDDGIRDDSPFEVFIGDPRTTFVVYRSDLKKTPLFACSFVKRKSGTPRYSIYTKTRYYEVQDDYIWVDRPNWFGEIPIIEYPANTARLGAFEIVIPLLDAINNVDSNALDDIEQTVQALLLFHNVNIDGEEFEKLRQQGALKFNDADPTMPGEVKYIIANLGVNETKIEADHLYETVLTICGMPNRNGGSSTSDTGAAVIMRDGWSSAEARAKDTELMFKRSEKEALKLMLKIIRTVDELDLKLSDIDIRFTRRNYENIKEKAEVLTMMLNNGQIAPQLAFTHSGMFSDPQVAYNMSRKYADGKEGTDTSGAEDGSGNSGIPGEGTLGGAESQEG